MVKPFSIHLSLFFAAVAGAWSQSAFLHPGLLHTHADLDRMRSAVAEGREPWKAAWAEVRAAPVSRLTYAHHAVAVLSVASGGAAGTGQQDDASAAHFHAVQWVVIGDEAHARKAMEILDSWSAVLKTMGGSNARLQCGIAGYHFLNAAEILKHAWTGWPAENQTRFRRMMLEIFYPVIKPWAPTFNGNWDAYMMATLMSIGIFADSAALFDDAVKHFHTGESKGALRNYVFPSGQCQESTRDQMHVQMGLGALSVACETAWNQGMDLYGALDNRLLLGLEYSAKYNLGQSVPAVGTISSQGRGTFYPTWELAYNHYTVRRGLDAPMVRQVITRIRPEKYQQDYVSLGTFLFYRETGSTGVRYARELRGPRLGAPLTAGRLRTVYDARGVSLFVLEPGTETPPGKIPRWGELGRVVILGTR